MQAYGRYGINKIQGKVEQWNINQGLFRSWTKAQSQLNSVKDQVLKANTQGWIKQMSESKYFSALAAGLQGKSIERMGILEAGALGRFYATKQKNLTNARFAFTEGTKLSRRRAANAQEKEFAKVAFNPSEDVAPPVPVMQNVGMALLGDAIGLAGTVAGFYNP